MNIKKKNRSREPTLLRFFFKLLLCEKPPVLTAFPF